MHTEGSRNPSDFLSRHPGSNDDSRQGALAEEYVNFIAAAAVPKAMTLPEIQEATTRDVTLQCVAELIRNQSWNNFDSLTQQFQDVDITELKLFKRVKDDLTVNYETNIILRNNRIVIPTVLRDKAISIAHEGHQGLVKTKQLLREKIWFPGIDQAVKSMIDKCIACQANGPDSRPEPLQMSPLPPDPWHTVHMDFCGPFPTGEYVFVVIDAYSRFPEVEIVRSTSASSIMPKLDRIFSTHGIPQVIRSDNGPPFTSKEINEYMRENGIDHRRITPLWPQANSEAESFMKPLTKAIRSAHAEGRSWMKCLYKFLLNYRTTPHSTTGCPPAELLFNRKVRNKLPHITAATLNDDKSTNFKEVREKDRRAKLKMKTYADERTKAKSSDIKIGDAVLARQRKQNKFSTRFDPVPFQVVRIKGTMITARRNEKYITRNVSQFKIVDSSLGRDKSMTDDDDEDNEDLPMNPEQEMPIAVRGQNANVEVNSSPPNNVRRSTRDRRKVHRFGQNIYEQ